MAKKAKWLEESTNQELLGEVLEKLSLGEDIEKKDINRAIKAVEELMERLPDKDESKISVEEALELLRGEFEKHISLVEAAYQAELDAMDEDEDFDEDFEDEDEEDFDEEDEDEEDEDYSDWTVKELRAECRKRGISTKGLKKADMLELLLDEDEEDFEEDFDEDFEDEDFEDEDFDEEDEIEYSELPTKALKDLCRERGIKVRKGMKKADFIRALEADDEE